MMTIHSIRKKLVRKRVLVPVAVVLILAFLGLKYGVSLWLGTRRAELEQVLKTETGLDAKIKGSITATLLPVPGVALGEVEFSRSGKSVATAQEFQASFEVGPLVHRKLVVRTLDLYGLKLRLVTDASGVPQFSLGGEGATSRIGLPPRTELRNSTIDVVDSAGRSLYSVGQLNLALYLEQSASPASAPGDSRDPSLTAYLNFQQAKLRDLPIGPTQASVRYRPGHTVVDIARANVLGGIAHGKATWSGSGPAASVHAKFSIRKFEASESAALFGRKPFARGQLNLEGDLSAKGAGPATWPGTLTGSVKLAGENLELTTTDLDALIASTIKSQKYNLVDAAAYFFVGPLGASATKGMDIAGVFLEFGKPGTTRNRILRLNSEWTIADGTARTRDVALETPKYLLAMKGGVNLATRRFDKLRIAVVNERGCAIASQTIDGPITSPRIEKMNILLTLTRPVIDALAKSAKALLTAGKCDPFYTGVLLPARPAKKAQGSAPENADEKKPETRPSTAEPGESGSQ
jgi:AsmA protein